MPAVLCENRTKSALDHALRQLLEQKSLAQIRVREVTELCMIRRQSFYYHFPDVHALFDWSLQQERAFLLERQENYLTWQQTLTDLLEHLAQHRSYYLALLQNKGRGGLRELLSPVLNQLLSHTMEYYQRRCGMEQTSDQLTLDCLETLLLTLLEGWIQDETQQPEQTLSVLDTMIRQGAVGAAWQNLPAQSC